MALLRSLFRLFPSGAVALEDFHTEVAAHVMQSLPEATLAWLREIGATNMTRADDVIVTTQEKLSALELHATGSRPDIAIRLAKDGERELIYVESKIGANEGTRQLDRYVDHLERRPERQKTLVFITRSYEPKELAAPNGVAFVQTRWSDFYRTFSSRTPRTELLGELLKFMEEHHMSQSNKFTSIDVLSLSNFSRARKLMDATLWESVHKKFVKFCGKMFWKESAFTQLKNHGRYVMAAGFGQGHQFEVLLGYWTDQDIITDSPWLGITWHVNPKASARCEIVAAMEDYERVSNAKWKAFNLTDEKAWGGLACGKNLSDFFSEDDHVKSITDLFETLLDDVQDFKKRYPQLPWAPQQTEG
jgi:hypothetical protein